MKQTTIRSRRPTLYAAMLAILGLLAYACRPDPDYYKPLATRTGSILNDLSQDPNYSLFVQAVQRSGYKAALGDGAGIFTVFAPDNASFQAFMQANKYASLEAIPANRLVEYVGNHILSSRLLYPAEVQTQRFNPKKDNRYPTIQGERFLTVVATSASEITVNGVKVPSQPVSVGNGVYYKMNQFLPPQISIDSTLKTTPAYSEFYKMVARFKYRQPNPQAPYRPSPDGSRIDTNFVNLTRLTWNVASDADVFTMFAPNNDAIRAFLAQTPYTRVEDLPEGLAQLIVEYHLAPPPNTNTYLAPKRSADLKAGDALVTPSGSLTIGTNLALTDVSQPDITVSNGVLHGIKKVIVPPALNYALGRAFLDPDLTAFSRLAFRSGVAWRQYLGLAASQPAPYTVLAPTNAAFAAAGLTNARIDALTPANAQLILQSHLINRALRSTELVPGTTYNLLANPAKTLVYNAQGKFVSDAGKPVGIAKADVMGTIGVLHHVDGVLTDK